jgi:hypothetical protein
MEQSYNVKKVTKGKRLVMVGETESGSAVTSIDSPRNGRSARQPLLNQRLSGLRVIQDSMNLYGREGRDEAYEPDIMARTADVCRR